MKGVILLEGETNVVRRLADNLQDMIDDNSSEYEGTQLTYMEEENARNNN